MQSLPMSAPLASARSTRQKAVDGAVTVLGDHASEFAALGIERKIALLRECMFRTAAEASAWVEDAMRAKGSPALTGEDWFEGPVTVIRNLRLLAETLEHVVRSGDGRLGRDRMHVRGDGRLEVRTFPTDALDGALFRGFSVHQLMRTGAAAEETWSRQAAIYRGAAPTPGVSLVLGAGNASAIAACDVLQKMFSEGRTVALKVNPVNEWAGPHFERALAPLIERGFLRVLYGGAAEGSYLANHPNVHDVHITGSNHTHDAIVWGPPGADRRQRMAAGAPLLRKPITSELGNVSPVAIVPAAYSEAEIDFIARNVSAMLTQNASFNCNAAKVLVVARDWPQRGALLDAIGAVLSRTATRIAYYPGARERYGALTDGRVARHFGDADRERLPWTLLADVDSRASDDPLFNVEPFCPLLAETALDAATPAEFLDAFTRFANDTLWGTLNATIIVPPREEKSAEIGAALDRAILNLRYGSIGINHWPALVYAMVSPAWGGHPSSTLADVQSGIGWVHNTYLLDGIEKSVLRGPLTVSPKPVWFSDNQMGASIGRRFVDFELSPGWLKVPALAVAALRG